VHRERRLRGLKIRLRLSDLRAGLLQARPCIGIIEAREPSLAATR